MSGNLLSALQRRILKRILSLQGGALQALRCACGGQLVLSHYRRHLETPSANCAICDCFCTAEQSLGKHSVTDCKMAILSV